MPQLNKGGKFVFGKSLVREDLSLCLPPQAVEEYDICSEGRVYLFTGAKATGLLRYQAGDTVAVEALAYT